MTNPRGVTVDELIIATEKAGGYFTPEMTYDDKRAFVQNMLDELESAGVMKRETVEQELPNCLTPHCKNKATHNWGITSKGESIFGKNKVMQFCDTCSSYIQKKIRARPKQTELVQDAKDEEIQK